MIGQVNCQTSTANGPKYTMSGQKSSTSRQTNGQTTTTSRYTNTKSGQISTTIGSRVLRVTRQVIP